MDTINEIINNGKEELDKKQMLKWCDASAGKGQTFQENFEILSSIKIIYKTLHERFQPSLNTKFMDFPSSVPIYPAPVAGLNRVFEDGEKALVKVCSDLGIPVIVFDGIKNDISDIVKLAVTPVFWVLKPLSSLKQMESVIRKAEIAGVSAIGINVDVISGMQSGDNIAELKNISPNEPNYYKKLRSLTNLPIFIKGILHPDDVIKVEELGYNGIVLSNHGGRVLDSLVSPLQMLHSFKKTTNLDILIDGGFRNGLDVYKGLACGANGILIGRPILYSLAAGGEDTLSKYFTLLINDLCRVLELTDTRDIQSIDSTTILM